MTWREQAACRGRTDLNWFPDASDLRALAACQLVCRNCSVKDECADHAHVEPERYGVWAGVNVGIATDEERRRQKNRNRVARRKLQREGVEPVRRLTRGPMGGEDDPRHGTINGYTNLSCRCDRCRTAWREYEREHDRKRRLQVVR